MKLTELRIFHNRYDFENEGVPPHGYGAVASFELPAGKFDVRYSMEVVNQIMTLLAPITADAFHDVSKITEGDVRRSINDNLLPSPQTPVTEGLPF